MKSASPLIVCLSLLLGCISIEMMPKKIAVDNLTKSDSTFIIPYDAKPPVAPESVTSASDIYFNRINAAQVKGIASEYQVTWIAIWANWCPHSMDGLTRKYVPLEEEFKFRGLKLLLVAQDINMSYMQSQIFQSGIHRLTYVIDPGTYGPVQNDRVRKFLSEFSPGLDSIYSASPKHLLINNKGNLIKAFMGDVINSDSIRKYCFNGK